MAYVESLACDECTKVLDGTVGTAKQQQDFIRLQGRVSKCHWDKELGWVYVFITRETEKELVFCGANCMGSFIERRFTEFLPKAVESLRRKRGGEY